LNLTKVVGLRQSLDVEELRDGLDVGEPRSKGLVTETRETVAQVDARRQGVERDTNPCHLASIEIGRRKERSRSGKSQNWLSGVSKQTEKLLPE
jgi:hypothetical protein